MGAFVDLFNQLDTDDRVKGKQFERICKWFLTNDPVYKHELRRVWLWNEWPGKWGIDAGIDLVAEDRQGHLWAIQAKAYNPAYRVTKRDVNKFLAESGREVFTYRMLIATTNLIDRIGERTIQDQEKRVTFFRLNDLETANVDWPRSPDDLRPTRPYKQARARKHQREAITQVLKGFGSTDRGQLIMACGTGKTLTSLFINQKLEATRTLVLLPSLSLLKQTLNVWRANSNTEFMSLPVCSDDTVAQPDDDLAVEHITDLGVPATTDPEDIATFLRQRSGPRVVFATYQSSPQIAKAFTLGRVPGFDFVIADEAHRCAGPVSSDFATVLDPVAIRARRRLYMTATPRYFTGRVLKAAQQADYEIASMDDEARFGPVFHKLSFGEAIERDLLTDYRVAIVGVDDATYLEWAVRGALVTPDGVKVTDARTLAGQIGLAKAMRKYDLHRVISFHSRVKRAREFAASMPDVIEWMPSRHRPKGDIWSRYASGEMPAGDRYVLLKHLGWLDVGDRGLLANARCLAEGVDVPTLDGVAFIDPRRSEVDIVQAVGRAIRLAPDKTLGTVVIPVFVDTDADPEDALNDSAFKPVWDVLIALRAHDEELAEQLDECRRELGALKDGGKLPTPTKITIDLPGRERVGAAFVRAFEVKLVEMTTAPWEQWFGMLERYIDENGHALVPRDYTVNGYKLGLWVTNQRALHLRGVLAAERECRLEDLAGWTWDVLDDKFEQAFSRLQRYVDRHGDARVPDSYEDDGYKLGAWVGIQRQRKAKGVLSPDRAKRFDELPGWTWDWRTSQWEEDFTRLQTYVEQNGHARVPRSYTVDGDPLGFWVQHQRQFRAKGILSGDREHRLEALPGWSWDTRLDQWEEVFTRLQAYVKRNGDAGVPLTCIDADGYKLGVWVGTQRGRYAGQPGKARLSSDQRHRLEALPGWRWDARDSAEKFEEAFKRLQAYVKQNGDAQIPALYKTADGYGLGGWVHAQRVKFANGTLDAVRQHRLEKVRGWTWVDDRWEEGFRRLQAYVKQKGDARVPQGYMVDGQKLGVWVALQRTKYNQAKLSADRQRRLEALPGWTWEPHADAWEKAFARLQAYAEQKGDTDVPSSYKDGVYKLGRWVALQRRLFAEASLDAGRRRRLQKLPGWTWKG